MESNNFYNPFQISYNRIECLFTYIVLFTLTVILETLNKNQSSYRTQPDSTFRHVNLPTMLPKFSSGILPKQRHP